jgi:PAS domain S-box-containing protein
MKNIGVVGELKNEIEVLKSRIEVLESENRKLKQVDSLISGDLFEDHNLDLSDKTSDIFYKVSDRRGVIYISSNVEEVLGYTSSELIFKQGWKNLIHPDDLHFSLDGLSSFTPYDIEYRIKNRKGECLWFRDKSILRIMNEDETIIIGISSDITVKKKQENIINFRIRLNELSITDSLDAVIRSVIDAAENLTDSTVGFFHFYDETTKTISLQTWSSNTIKHCRAVPSEKNYHEDKAGVWFDCVRKMKPVIHNNYEKLSNRAGLPEGHVPVIREMAVPVTHNNSLVAIIGVGNKAVEYNQLDMDTLSQFAHIAWEIIINKKLNLDLKEKNEKHSTLLNTMFEGVSLNELIYDEKGEISDFRILETNAAFSGLDSHENDRVTGKLAMEVYRITTDEIKTFWSENSDITKPFIKDFNNPIKNSWTRISISPVIDNKFTAAFFDVTELRASEETLRRNEDEYRTIVETSFDGFWIVDLKGNIIEVNNSYLRISGYTREEILSMSIAGIDISESKEDTESHIKKIVSTGHDVFETLHRRKDGSEWPVEINVTYAEFDGGKMFVFLRDITTRKENQKAICESEEKFRTLIQTSQDSILINENGIITYANDAALKLFATDNRQDIIGQRVLSLFHSDYHEFMESRADAILLTDKPVPQAEEKIIRKDGKLVAVDVTSSPFRYQGRKAIYISIRDITDRKIAEEEKELTIRLLSLINEKTNKDDLVKATVDIFKKIGGFDAVGIRYKEGIDFPYLETSGFSDDFILKEKFLCNRKPDGNIELDGNMNPVLDCMCGNVLKCRFNPDLPFFTKYGSFWTNSTTELLCSTTEEDRQSRTRNRCNGEGYESVALIPLKFGKIIFGLLQLNDHRTGMFDLNRILFFERLTAYLSGAFSHFESQKILKNNENRYRRVSSLISNIAYSCRKTGEIFRFDWIAGSVEKTFGCSYSEMIDKGCWRFLVHEEDRHLFDDNILSLKPGDKSTVDLRITTLNGEEKWINSIAECISENGDEVRIYGALIDITYNKQASEALRLSTEALREAQQIAKIGSWEYICATETFIISGETSRIFGWYPSEQKYPKNTFLSVINEDDQNEFQIKVQQSITSQSQFEHEFRIIHPGTGITWAYGIGKVIISSNGDVTGLKGTIQDITERKKAEQALNHSHDLMRYVIEHNRGAVAVHDRNMNYIYVSQRYIHDFGVTDPDIIGKNHYEVFPDLPQKFRDAHKESLKGKIVQSENDYWVRDDGSFDWTRWECRPWYEADGGIGGIIVYTEVITERKNFEIALKRSESQLYSLFNSAPVIMILVNESGEVLRMNRFGLELIMKSTDEVVGRQSGDVLNCVHSSKEKMNCGHSDHCASCTLRDTIEKTFRTGKEYFKVESEMSILGQRGIKNHTILVSTSIISEQPDKMVLLTIDDITLRKEMEVDLINAKEKAEESDKLKSAFLANISHEIRTPMNGIIGFSEMIQKPGLSNEKRRHFSELISDSCKQLLNIITDVIDISRIDTAQISVQISEINLNELLLEIFLGHRASAESKNISLYQKKALRDENAIIMTDHEKLKHILSNLIGNAVKFTNSGFIEYGYNIKEKYIEFFVRDTGIGIRPELHAAVFERFRQAETSDTRTYGGAGLGLSISKGLVEIMGGNIWLESEYGKGSTFYFNIPYNPCGISISAGAEDKRKINDQHDEEVLIVEDDDINYLFLEELLQSFNFITFHAKNGLEAIQQYKENPRIKIIFMDLKMPVMDGFEAARELKKYAPQVPIIAQTAFFSSEIDEMKNFDGYISKPIQKSEMKKILSKYLKINEINS